MPHDVITTRRDIDTSGPHDVIIETQYEAPAGPKYVNGQFEHAPDPYREADLELAGKMMAWLRANYAGHLWCAASDLANGIVRFNIPILMGVNYWYVINLRKTTIEDGLVDGAGEILERYGLPRTHFNLGMFLDAREQHSRLVNQHRKVPD